MAATAAFQLLILVMVMQLLVVLVEASRIGQDPDAA
jgi:hypothetical protein